MKSASDRNETLAFKRFFQMPSEVLFIFHFAYNHEHLINDCASILIVDNALEMFFLYHILLLM